MTTHLYHFLIKTPFSASHGTQRGAQVSCLVPDPSPSEVHIQPQAQTPPESPARGPFGLASESSTSRAGRYTLLPPYTPTWSCSMPCLVQKSLQKRGWAPSTQRVDGMLHRWSCGGLLGNLVPTSSSFGSGSDNEPWIKQ